MPINKFALKPNSEERTEFPPFYSGTYIATGEDSSEAVELYAKSFLVPQLSSPHGQLWRQPIVTRRLGWQVFEVDASYGPKPWGPFEYTIRGRVGGETQKIKGSLQTIAHSTDAPIFSETVDGSKGGLIGVNADGTVEGTDILLSASELSIDVKAPAGYVNLAVQDSISGLVSSVNSTDFLVWKAGEVRYDSTEYSATNADSEFTVNVSIQKNLPRPPATSFTSAGLTITAKQGWDLLWFLFEEEDADFGGHTVKIQKAKHWYIERTMPRYDFKSVLGFG